MPAPIADELQFHAAAAPAIEAQVRQDAMMEELNPADVETIVQLVVKYGPSVYKAVLALFHVTPKA